MSVNVGAGLTFLTMSVMDGDVESVLLAVLLLKHVVDNSHLLDGEV